MLRILHNIESEPANVDKNTALSSLRTPQLPLGVLTDEELVMSGTVEGKRVVQSRLLPGETRELSGLLEYLVQQGVTTVWVLPGSHFSQRVTCDTLQGMKPLWTALVRPVPTSPDRPASALFLSSARQQRLTLAFPEHACWPWTLPDAVSLLATATYLDELLARPIVDTPAQCAQQLLSELTLQEPLARISSTGLSTLTDSQGTLIPFSGLIAEPSWLRPLTVQEQRQRYLHKYTALSRTLRACLAVHFGTGTPQCSANGRTFDGTRPGIWRVHMERAGSLFDGKLLPGCLDQSWLTTPLVVCCRSIGYSVQVQEGYAWSQSHQLLKPWASQLYQALERLHTQPRHFRHPQARANAVRSITLLTDQALALLDQAQEQGGWSRPDWRAHLLGQQQALLFADLVRLVKQGAMPVLLHGPSFWLVSPDPNPSTALPGLLSTKQNWSGLTPAYDTPLYLSPEVKALFRGGEPVEQVVSKLDGWAQERG